MNKIDFEKIKYLFLDLDGTLVNTEKAFYKSFRDVILNEYGIMVTPEMYRHLELEQNEMLIKTLISEGKISGENLKEYIMSKVYFDYKGKFEIVAIEKEATENFDLLKEIKKEGIKLALVTTSRWNFVNRLIELQNLNNTFDFIVAREDVKGLKPSPEAYFMALDALNAKKDESLAIEDSKRGVDSALNAGINVAKVENFTEIKYSYPIVEEYNSASDVLRKVLIKK